jgi:hypothetical protein
MKTTKRSGARLQQVSRAAEHFVAAELNRRGAYAVTFAGNMPRIDILASNADQTRTVRIQVKGTKNWRSSPDWQTTIKEGKRGHKPKEVDSYWILVDMKKEQPRYFIMPEYWIRNDIQKAHSAYLKRHGGKRKINPDSLHHSINLKRVEQWQDKWEILDIL